MHWKLYVFSILNLFLLSWSVSWGCRLAWPNKKEMKLEKVVVSYLILSLSYYYYTKGYKIRVEGTIGTKKYCFKETEYSNRQYTISLYPILCCLWSWSCFFPKKSKIYTFLLFLFSPIKIKWLRISTIKFILFWWVCWCL